MKLSYEFTRDDYTVFLQYHNKNSPTVQKRKFWSTVIGFFVCLLFPVLIARISNRPFLEAAKDMWPLFLSPLLFLMLVIPLSKFQTRRFYNKYLNESDNAEYFTEQSLSLEDDGIHLTSPQSQSIHFWSSFKQFILTSDYLFLYNSGLSAMVIPRRAF